MNICNRLREFIFVIGFFLLLISFFLFGRIDVV